MKYLLFSMIAVGVLCVQPAVAQWSDHFGPQPGSMTPNQKMEYDRVMQQSSDLIRQIENDPMFK